MPDTALSLCTGLRRPAACAGAAIAGSLLLTVGLGLAIIQQGVSLPCASALVAGIALLAHATFHGRASLARSIRRAHQSGAIYAGVFAFSVVGTTLLTNYLSYRHHRQWDLTRNHSWSLSTQTQNVLTSLHTPVTITAYIPPVSGIRVATGAVVPNPSYDRVLALLHRFTAYSNNIHTIAIDPDAQRSAVPAGVNPPEVLFHPETGPDRHLTAGFLEKDLAATLLQIERGKLRTHIYSLTGEGERPLTAPSNVQGDTQSFVPTALSTFRSLLEQQQYQVSPLDLAEGLSMPPDCDLLVIAGAQQELQPGPERVVLDYLRTGGKLLVLSDAPSTRSPSASLDAILRPYHLHMGAETVVGSGRVTGSPLLNLGGEFSPGHAITRDFDASSRLVLLQARPVTLIPPTPRDTRILASSDPDTWGETHIDREHDLDPADIAGPIPVAAAAGGVSRPGHPTARVVIIGCVSLASDQVIGALMGSAGRPNIHLLSNATSWLTSSDDLMGMPSPAQTGATRPATDEQIRFVTWAQAIGGPLLILFIGAVVYWRRR